MATLIHTPGCMHVLATLMVQVDLLLFFRDTYERVFGFKDGPPVRARCRGGGGGGGVCV